MWIWQIYQVYRGIDTRYMLWYSVDMKSRDGSVPTDALPRSPRQAFQSSNHNHMTDLLMLHTFKETYTDLFSKADESIKQAFEVGRRSSPQAKQLAEFQRGQYTAYIESCSKILEVITMLERSVDEEAATILEPVRL